MDKRELREFIVGLLKEKLLLFDISGDELNDKFDLVKSGLLDSMAFIDLIAETEEKYQIEIDFEKLADSLDFSTMGGLISFIINA